jgi:4'-phosphopantetheinyl transferase
LSGEGVLQAYFDASLNDLPVNWTFWQWRPTADSLAALCVENRPGVTRRVAVRRTIPWFHEEEMVFEVLRRSAS